MVIRYTTTSIHEGRRLDHYLAEQSPDLSRTLIRKIIDIGGVHIDGRRVRKAGLVLSAGRRNEVHPEPGAHAPDRLAE